MTKEQGELFVELLTNAGWLDDADEIIADMLSNDEPVENVRAKCKLIDTTLDQVNELTGGALVINAEAELDSQLED